MNYSDIKKLALRVFLGFLGLTALIAIVSVLGGEFGKFQWKSIGTSFTISAAGICAMSCAAFIEKQQRALLGLSGIGLSVVAAVFVVAGIWPEIESENYWKTTATIAVAAIAFAHAFLLVRPDFGNKQKWIKPVSVVSVGVLALQIIVAMWGEIDSEIYYRFMAAVAILVGLETAALPVLMKLGKENGQKRPQLLLEQLEDGLYVDSSGRRYRLKELTADDPL